MRSRRPVVIDNTVLSNLARVGHSELVWAIWGDAVCTTQPVQEEYEAGVAAGTLPLQVWRELLTVALTENELRLAVSLPGRLDPGERTCLAVAIERQGLLVTDDRAARNVAARRGVALSGTVGVLTRAIQRGHLSRDQANGLLQELIAAGYYAPIAQLGADDEPGSETVD